MKTIHKKLSVLLSIMMVLCMFTALPFSASAAESGGTISVTSNVADTAAYDYDANTTQVTVTYALKADNCILNAQAYVTYDSSVLSLASSNTESSNLPVLNSDDQAVVNYDIDGEVYFNSTDLNLFDFKTAKTFVTLTFDVVGSGDTTVDLNVEYLTGTEADSYSEFIAGASQIDYVNNSTVSSTGFTMTASAALTKTGTGDGATVKFACPTSNWSGGVYLYYGATNVVKDAEKIAMTSTGETFAVTSDMLGSLTKYTAGDWTVYSVTLTDDQVTAIDAANYAGFYSGSSIYVKTSSKLNVFSAYDSVADAAGKVFVIGGCTSSSDERATLTGSWYDLGTSGGDDDNTAATVSFACPTSNWSGGVYLYYGATNVVKDAEKIAMTSTGETFAVTSSMLGSLTKYTAGDWTVYSVTLTDDQVTAIDAANYAGFYSGSNIYVKTSSKLNVFSDYDSVADVEGKVFVIGGCTSSSDEKATLTGSWR